MNTDVHSGVGMLLHGTTTYKAMNAVPPWNQQLPSFFVHAISLDWYLDTVVVTLIRFLFITL